MHILLILLFGKCVWFVSAWSLVDEGYLYDFNCFTSSG